MEHWWTCSEICGRNMEMERVDGTCGWNVWMKYVHGIYEMEHVDGCNMWMEYVDEYLHGICEWNLIKLKAWLAWMTCTT